MSVASMYAVLGYAQALTLREWEPWRLASGLRGRSRCILPHAVRKPFAGVICREVRKALAMWSLLPPGVRKPAAPMRRSRWEGPSNVNECGCVEDPMVGVLHMVCASCKGALWMVSIGGRPWACSRVGTLVRGGRRLFSRLLGS